MLWLMKIKIFLTQEWYIQSQTKVITQMFISQSEVSLAPCQRSMLESPAK